MRGHAKFVGRAEPGSKILKPLRDLCVLFSCQRFVLLASMKLVGKLVGSRYQQLKARFLEYLSPTFILNHPTVSILQGHRAPIGLVTVTRNAY